MELISQTRLGCAFPGAMAILLAVCVTPLCAQVPPGALVVRSGVSFGGTLWVDSFDSADPAFSTGGRYDPAKFRANGDLRCPSLMNIYGNTVIHGRVWAPSYVTSGFASVGNTNWTQRGIQPGWWQSAPSFQFEDVSTPYSDAPQPSGGTLEIGGVTNTFGAILGSGDYLLLTQHFRGGDRRRAAVRAEWFQQQH